MTFGQWVKKYWPWLLPGVFLIVYELIALVSPAPTLSRLVWWAADEWPPLVWIVTAITVILWIHFFVRTPKPSGGSVFSKEPVVLFGAGSIAISNIIVQVAKAYGLELTPENIAAVFTVITAIVTWLQRRKVTPVQEG